jgi:inositol transport system substrate-binding protein
MVIPIKEGLDMKWKMIFTIVLTLGITFLFSVGPEIYAEDKQLTVGACIGNLSQPFQARIAKAIERQGQLFGIRTIAVSAKWDTATQVQQIEQFIARKVDLIIVMAVSAEGVVPGIKKANSLGIPVVVCLDSVVGGDFTYVGSVYIDGAGGKLAGKFIAEKLNGKGNVVVIQGGSGFTTTWNRWNGFKAEIDQHPGLKVIYRQYGDWDAPSGLRLMDDALTKFPNKGQINAVYCHNDDMALGAMQSLQRAGRLDEVVLVGIDGVPPALAAVKDGKMDATIYQNAEAIGTYAMVNAVKLLHGQQPAKYNFVPWSVVTKENVDLYEDIAQVLDKGTKFLVDSAPRPASKPPADWPPKPPKD